MNVVIYTLFVDSLCTDVDREKKAQPTSLKISR